MLDCRDLLLIPGLVTDSRVWQFQEKILTNTYPELHIHHASVYYQDSIAAMADNVLRSAPDTFALAGCSMGGYVALAMLAKAAKRIKKLALINTNARAATEESKQERQARIAAVKNGKYGSLMQLGMGQYFSATHKKNKELLDLEAEMAMALGPDVYICQQTACMNRKDRRAELANIHCKTLIIAGEDDPINPLTWSQEMADAISEAKLHIIKDCGHISILEQPAIVADALCQWLQEE